MSNVDDNDTMKDTLDTNGKREYVEEPAKKRPKTDDSSNVTPNKKKAKKKNKPPPEVLSLRRSIQQCCATNDLFTAMDLYQDAVSQNISMEAQTFYHLLNLCDGLGADKRLHIGTPKPKKTPRRRDTTTPIRPVDAKTRQEFAFALKQRMDALKLPLNEPAYTALVRLLCKSKLVQEAEKLLKEAETVSQCKPKLRLYSSLLIAYCELGQMRAALTLWQRLSQRNLLLTEREYAALMQCAITTGNAGIMERVLSDLSEDVLVPSHTTTKCIVEWFTSPHATTVKHNDNTNDSLNDDIELTASNAPSMGPIQSQFAWHISHNCHVDTETGMLQAGCLAGHALQPVTLKSWHELKTMNETIVLKGMLDNHTSLYQGGGKGPKQRVDAEKRRKCWKDFQTYLQKRGHIDVVIDGANVGYYKQNFGSAPQHVDYRQIDSMVKHFLNHKKSILLVMHQRHFSSNLLPNWATRIVESWNDILYKTPTGMNDDWFWLHAALQHKSLVITNDEMRDHHFQMLSPRNFLRWKERHQVHFDITNNEVCLKYPDTYSRRIQRINGGLVVPLPKRGDERRYLDGMHVAEDAPIQETYLCIRPNIQE